MRILIVHNQYKKQGGEDMVIAQEKALLELHGHQVEVVFFSNAALHNIWAKLLVAPLMWYNPSSAKRVRQKIQAFMPDVLHVHNLFNVASPAVLYVAQKMGIPVVMTLHNYRLLCLNALFLRQNKVCELCRYSTWQWAGVWHRCFGNSMLKSWQLAMVSAWHKKQKTWQTQVTLYIALTAFAKRIFSHSILQIPADKISIKPNFIALPQGLGNKKTANYFIFVGRLSPEKGVEIAIQAALQAGVCLHIIGEGELLQKVKEYAELYPEHIKYQGAKPKQEVLAAVQQAKALLFPSVWYEGMPMTIIEAFAVGTPVLASQIDSIAEVVSPTFKEWLFEVGKFEVLAQKITNFQALSPEAEFEWQQKAKAVYASLYSAEQNYVQLIRIYEQAIAFSKES